MKIKRFAIERIPIEVEYVRTIAGRLFLLAHFHKLIKYVKKQLVRNDIPVCKSIYRLYSPQIEVKKHDER